MRTVKDKTDREIKDVRENKENREIKDKTDREIKDVRENKDIRENKENREVKEQRKKPSGVVEGLVGKNISIYLRNGNILKGKLESVAQYELIATISYKPVIIMKHAVDYIELTDEK